MDSLLETYRASSGKDGTMGLSQSQKAGQRGVASCISVFIVRSNISLWSNLFFFFCKKSCITSCWPQMGQNPGRATLLPATVIVPQEQEENGGTGWGGVTMDFPWSSPTILVALVSCLLTSQRLPFPECPTCDSSHCTVQWALPCPACYGHPPSATALSCHPSSANDHPSRNLFLTLTSQPR